MKISWYQYRSSIYKKHVRYCIYGFVFRADQTKKGHCLGSPANREITAVPERGLTALATCLIRLLVHGSMLIGSCSQPQVRFLIRLQIYRLALKN